MNGRPDRDRIRSEYVTGNASLRALAEEYGVAPTLVREWSKADGWVAERKKYREGLRTAYAKKAQKQALDALDMVMRTATMAIQQVSSAMEDPRMLQRYVSMRTEKSGFDATTEMVENTFARVDMTQFKNMMDAMKTGAEIIRQIARIPTQAEEAAQNAKIEQLQLERDKFEADKAKDVTGQDITVRMELPEGFDV